MLGIIVLAAVVVLGYTAVRLWSCKDWLALLAFSTVVALALPTVMIFHQRWFADEKPIFAVLLALPWLVAEFLVARWAVRKFYDPWHWHQPEEDKQVAEE